MPDDRRRPPRPQPAPIREPEPDAERVVIQDCTFEYAGGPVVLSPAELAADGVRG
jgi:hypothetical protein